MAQIQTTLLYNRLCTSGDIVAMPKIQDMQLSRMTCWAIGTAWDIKSHAQAQTSLSMMLINRASTQIASTNILQHTKRPRACIKSQDWLVRLLCLQWVCWSSARCFEEPPLQIPSQLLLGHTPYFLPALLSVLRFIHIVRCGPRCVSKGRFGTYKMYKGKLTAMVCWNAKCINFSSCKFKHPDCSHVRTNVVDLLRCWRSCHWKPS